jgi:hypothetical protein
MPLLAHLFLALIMADVDSPSTLTVCEALARLDDLNNGEVRIRGAWFFGDTGELIVSPEPCPHPTVRDGWQWRDFIGIDNIVIDDENGRVIARRLATFYRRASKVYRKDDTALVMVTFSGRLETTDHFKVRKFVRGSTPLGYGGLGAAVAGLIRHDASDLEVTGRAPIFNSWWGEVARSPEAVRAR